MGKEDCVYSMAESDHSEPYRTHDQVHIPTPNVVDKTAATNLATHNTQEARTWKTLDWKEIALNLEFENLLDDPQ